VAGVKVKKYFAIERHQGPQWQHAVPMRGQLRWAEHAAFMNELAASGKIILGGPIGSEGEVLLIADVPTEAEAQAMLEADPWTGMGLLVVSRVREWTILLESRRMNL
jgi:uncharacterized protein YciI